MIWSHVSHHLEGQYGLSLVVAWPQDSTKENSVSPVLGFGFLLCFWLESGFLMLGSALLQSYTQPCTGTMQVSSYIMFADIMLDKESHDPVHLLGSQSCIAKACARGLGSE